MRLATLQASDTNAFSGHLADPQCSTHRVRGDFVWYQAPRQAGVCGNVLKNNDTNSVYFNSLFLYPQNNKSFSFPEIITFFCVYSTSTNASVDSGFTVLFDKGLSGTGSPNTASMGLFRDSSFRQTYPEGPLTLTVGSALYFGVSVDEPDPSFSLVLDTCYISNSSNPDDSNQYYLITSRCPTNRQRVSVIESGGSLEARFSALLFPVEGVEGVEAFVHLHCTLSLCDKRLNSCVPFCAERGKRSVHDSAQLYPLTAGPVFW